MQSRNILKICYGGLLHYISYDNQKKYADILANAIERLKIADEFKNFLQITDKHGYVFDSEIFDNFLLLFPNPDIVFFLRLDYNRMLNEGNEQKADNNYGCVPVFRQNCFIGALPPSKFNKIQKSDKMKSLTKRRRLFTGRNAKKRAIVNNVIRL